MTSSGLFLNVLSCFLLPRWAARLWKSVSWLSGLSAISLSLWSQFNLLVVYNKKKFLHVTTIKYFATLWNMSFFSGPSTLGEGVYSCNFFPFLFALFSHSSAIEGPMPGACLGILLVSIGRGRVQGHKIMTPQGSLHKEFLWAYKNMENGRWQRY